MESRLPQDANTTKSRAQYLATRAKQLQTLGYTVVDIKTNEKDDDGLSILVLEDGNSKRFVSVYLSPGIRGRGMLKKVAAEFPWPIITIRDCNISGYLEFNDIPHVVELGIFDTVEYGLIEDYYGDRKAERSGVWLMNHIDEGLAVLSMINADIQADAIFCLHPLVQNDNDLLSNLHLMSGHRNLDWEGALEYRSVANEYLANRDITDISEIRLSENKHVNDALIADKVQNYKDFMLYHYGTHKNSDRLFNYFHNWFDRLKIKKKTLIDLLINLYDNDYMKEINNGNIEDRISRIITQTQIERDLRS